MTESRTDTVVCWGDSQTAGFSWGNRLPALSETITTAIGRGISGQEAGTVAVRQGGITLTTTAPVTIPATADPIDVEVQADVTPCNIRYGASDMPVVLAGVRGTLTVIATENSNATTLWNRGTGTGTLRFTPDDAPANAVEVPADSTFTSQDVTDHPEYSGDLTIIWVGGNDASFAGTTRVTGVTAAVKAMVDRLHSTVDNPRFLVAGRTTGPTNTEGTSSWQTAVDQRDQLAALYPDNAIDIWGHVRDHGLEILGLEPTDADLAAIEGKTVPPSLTSDGLHFTTQTREQVLAPFIISELAARGWTTPKAEVVPVAEYTPTNWKNKPDTSTPLSADNFNNIEAGIQQALEAVSAAGQGVTDLRTDLDDKADKSDLDKKVNSSSTKNTVYGISNGGNQYQYPTGISTIANGSIVMRGADGATKVGPATNADHAVPLAQANENYVLKTDYDALAARVAALETPPAG